MASTPVQVVMDLRCGEQVEGFGDDEIYITASITTRSGQSVTRQVWAGDMADDDHSKRYVTGLLAWDGELSPGDAALVVMTVGEQDGESYEPGLRFAAMITQRVASVMAAGDGGGDAAKVAKYLDLVDFDALISAADAAFGLKNTDDFPGTFAVSIVHEANSLRTLVFPTWRSRWVGSDLSVLRLDGDGSQYFPGVRINGQNVPHLK